MVLASCAQHEEAKDFYDRAEAGSTWALDFSGGKLVDEAYGSGYTGACPMFTDRDGMVPANTVDICEPGCTCSFSFELDDDGDVGDDYATTASFTEQCPDGSSLDCIEPSPDDGVETGFCTWVSGTIPSSVDPFGDCTYDFRISETD
nr:hypothetical protein [Kofleriaceae bacterium]